MLRDDWEGLPPGTRRLIKGVAKVGVPLFFLALFDRSGTLAFAWLFLCFCYFAIHLLRWALHADRLDKDSRNFDKSFMDDLKDIESKVRGVIPGVPPRKAGKPKVFNSQGDPMTCIMCESYTNKGGRYCDEHDG